MKKHIAEELPARKHAPAAAPAAGDRDGAKGGKDEKSPEKRIRQAVYDIRYRARREDVPLRTAYAQYMQNSNLGANERSAVKAKLFGDGPMKTEQFVASAKELASESLSNALIKVFVGEELDKPKKYKVRVEDNNGKSYVRYADRAKITELRANPNIRSVEITEYGEPYEGERKKGERTAAAKAGKDWDKDGKKESPAKEYRGVVHNAIQRKRGEAPDGQDTSSVKEDFIIDASVNEEKKGKLDILPKNQTNKVKVYTGKEKGLGEAKMTSAEKEEEEKLKKKYDKSGMKASMKKQYGERGEEVYFATIRKKAMQNAGYEPEGESIQEGESVMKSAVSRFRDKMKEREEQGKEAEKFAADTCDKCGKFPCECDDRARQTSMDLYKNKLRARGIKVASITPAPSNMKTADDLGEAVDRAEYEKIAKEPAPKDDKKAAYAFKDNKRRQKDLKKLARLVRHADGQKRNPAMYNSFEPEGEVVAEEESDRAKDKRQERGGVGANVDYDRSPAKKKSNDELGIKPGETWVQKQMRLKHGKGASAADIVRKETEEKHGKGSIKK